MMILPDGPGLFSGGWCGDSRETVSASCRPHGDAPLKLVVFVVSAVLTDGARLIVSFWRLRPRPRIAGPTSPRPPAGRRCSSP
jgi:hypothetical protein